MRTSANRTVCCRHLPLLFLTPLFPPSAARFNVAHSGSCAEFAEEFLLIHAVLESLAAVDEDDGDLVVIKAADFSIGLHVDFAPVETAPLVELDEALFDNFAEMASLTGIDDDFAGRRHARECSSFGAGFQESGCGTTVRDKEKRRIS